MPSLNRVILVGRLTRDPEMRYTTSGLAVTTFSLAVDRRYKSQSGEKQTDFFRCKAWRQKAEFIANYITKGRLVAVEGSIETSEVVGQDGQKKYFTDIVCDNVEILESNREHGGEGGAPSGGYSGGQSADAGGDYHADAGAEGNGYYADEDMSAAPRGGQSAPPSGNRPAPRSAGNGGGQAQGMSTPAAARGAGAGGGNAPQRAGAAAAGNRPASGGGRPAPQAQPAYPADDFDDSDPFADE